MAKERTKFMAWCRENGKLAKEVAADLDISVRTVYAWTSGRRCPTRSTMRKIREMYGVDPSELFPL